MFADFEVFKYSFHSNCTIPGHKLIIWQAMHTNTHTFDPQCSRFIKQFPLRALRKKTKRIFLSLSLAKKNVNAWGGAKRKLSRKYQMIRCDGNFWHIYQLAQQTEIDKNRRKNQTFSHTNWSDSVIYSLYWLFQCPGKKKAVRQSRRTRMIMSRESFFHCISCAKWQIHLPLNEHEHNCETRLQFHVPVRIAPKAERQTNESSEHFELCNTTCTVDHCFQRFQYIFDTFYA